MAASPQRAADAQQLSGSISNSPGKASENLVDVGKYLGKDTTCAESGVDWHYFVRSFARNNRLVGPSEIHDLHDIGRFVMRLFSKPSGYHEMSIAKRRWVDATRLIIKRRAVQQTRNLLSKNEKLKRLLEMTDSKISFTPSLLRQLILDGQSLTPRKGDMKSLLDACTSRGKDLRVFYEPKLLSCASKYFYNASVNVDIHIYYHDPVETLLPIEVLEIAAYDCTNDREMSRLYLDYARVSQVLMPCLSGSSSPSFSSITSPKSGLERQRTQGQQMSSVGSNEDESTCFSEPRNMSEFTHATLYASMVYTQALLGSWKTSLQRADGLSEPVAPSVEDFLFQHIDVEMIEKQRMFCALGSESQSESESESNSDVDEV